MFYLAIGLACLVAARKYYVEVEEIKKPGKALAKQLASTEKDRETTPIVKDIKEYLDEVPKPRPYFKEHILYTPEMRDRERRLHAAAAVQAEASVHPSRPYWY